MKFSLINNTEHQAMVADDKTQQSFWHGNRMGFVQFEDDLWHLYVCIEVGRNWYISKNYILPSPEACETRAFEFFAKRATEITLNLEF